MIRIRRGIALRAVRGAGRNDRFLRAMAVVAPHIDRTVHRLTGGRRLLMPALLPSLMLTTTGNVTGRPRRVPLLCRPEDDGSYLVVASNSGRAAHPSWSNNLLSDPRATITRGGRTVTVTATLLDGADRSAAWNTMVEFWPGYETYARRSTRRMRIFRLSPA